MWSGNLTFGLVHVPVKLYSATQDNSISFHQVHLADGGRIKYLRECQTCHKTVSYSEIGKGYEDDAGRRVVLSDEDLEGLPVAHSRDVEIIEFVPVEQIDPIYFDKAYYLEPAANAAKPYVLLRQALAQTDRMAVVMFAMRQRSRMAVLRVRGDVLVLQTMLWPDEVRVAQFDGIADDDISIRPQELTMAGSLVESLSADFDPEQFHDEYREAVQAMLERKLEGQDVILPAEESPGETGGQVVDLMAALAESVRRSKAARSGEGASETADGPAGAAAESQPPASGSDGEPTAKPRRPRKAAGSKQPGNKSA
jgi:DNA end-binding protein Ku